MSRMKSKPNRADTIAASLRSAISDGRVPANTLITEKTLSDIFQVSRTPIRTALQTLEQQAVIMALPGRGFAVAENGQGTADPPRRLVRLSSNMLAASEDADPAYVTTSSGSIEAAFEEALIDALPFGQFWINEKDAADHFAVSRTVVRELLIKFQDRMLVQKDSRSHWVVGPMTARMIDQHYEIRAELEPLALRLSAPLIKSETVTQMMKKIDRLRETDQPSLKDMLDMESDIHVRLLAGCPNPMVLHMLRHAQVPLAVNRIFLQRVGTISSRHSLSEHYILLDLTLRGAIDAACEAMHAHILFGAQRMRQRLKTFSVFPVTDLPPFLRERRNAVVR